MRYDNEMAVARFRKRLESVLEREVDGEVILLDTAADLIHRLNTTASYIWRRCDVANCAEDIASELSGAYDVEGEQALSDVTTTLDALKSLNLISEARESHEAGQGGSRSGEES